MKATYAVTLISRVDTVNLSNMSVASESVYELDAADRTDSAVSWLSEKLAALALGGTIDNDKWKITRFNTSPPVRL